MYDVVVVGGGAAGLATAYKLSTLGVKTLLVEQLNCPNTRGSSSGQSRVLSIDENSKSITNQLESLALEEWKEIEKLSSTSLLLECKKHSYAKKATRLHSKDSKRKKKEKVIKGLKIQDLRQLISIKSSWILKTVKCLQALKVAFLANNGVLLEEEKVFSVVPIHQEKVEIHTSRGLYLGKQVILTCGPWTNDLLLPLEIQLPLKIYRHQVGYFRATQFLLYEYQAGFPVVSFENKDSSKTLVTPIYEYPDLLKVEVHSNEVVEVTADQRDRIQLTKEEKMIEENALKTMENIIDNHFTNVNNKPSIIETMISCKVANDNGYVVDRHGDYENVVIACGFGEDQFTLSPAIACMLASLVVEGHESADSYSHILEKFSLKRFDSLREAL